MFERFTDRARRVVVLAQEEARLLNHSYIGTEHILLGPDPRGRRRRGEGAREPRHLARGCAQPGRGDHRPGRLVAVRAHPLHAASEEGPRAVPARGAAARPQLHRHRAHPPRADPRGRGRRRPGPRQARRRPVAGPPAGHPAAVGLPGSGRPIRGRTARGRQRRWVHEGRPSHRQGQQPDPRPVRSQLHPARPRAQARSGHRAHPRARAGHADPVPADEEQPGADRRAGRRQDGHRRGPGPDDRQQRRARHAAQQAAVHARPRRPGRRVPLPRRLRGAPEEGPQGDQDPRRHPAVHRRDPHARRCRRRRGRHRRGLDPQADAGPRRAADDRGDDHRRVPQVRREGRRARAPLPAGEGRRADARPHDRDPQGHPRPVRGAPPGDDHRPSARRRRQPGRPLHLRPLPAGQGDRPHRRGR